MKKLAICLAALLFPVFGCEVNVDEKPGTTVAPAPAPDVDVKVPAPAPNVDVDVTTPAGKSVDIDVKP